MVFLLMFLTVTLVLLSVIAAKGDESSFGLVVSATVFNALAFVTAVIIYIKTYII